MFGAELQPAACRHVEPADLARDRGDAGSAQTLLDRHQEEFVARRPNEDEARRIEPERSQPRPIEIGAGEAPQHGPAVPRWRRKPADKVRGESGGQRAILLVAARAEDFMHRAAQEAAAGQGAVDRGEPQGRRPVAGRRAALDLPHPLAQGGEQGLVRSHMFIVCSYSFDVNPARLPKRRRA